MVLGAPALAERSLDESGSDVMLRGAMLLLLAGCASAAALPPPGTHSPGSTEPRAAYFEIEGDYSGRQMRLTLDGVLAFEGARPAEPDGRPWRVALPPGAGFIEIELQLAPCEQAYRTRFMPDSDPPTLRVEGCHIVLLD